MLTNPPPSSGGILIAYALDLLERARRAGDRDVLVEVMDGDQPRARRGLRRRAHTEGYLERFLAKDAIESVADEVHSRLGTTTHIALLDADGGCASVTCSNGSCSGVIVPGTGMHLNNMLGEQDLNPLGYHRHERGARVPSMMAPTVVLRDGTPEVALGSAGSNRIRSAILQTLLNIVDSTCRPRTRSSCRALHLERGMSRPSRASTDARSSRSSAPAGRAALGRAQPLLRRRAGRRARPGDGRAVRRGDPRRGGVAVLVE